MLELAEQGDRAHGLESQIVLRPLPSDDPRQRQPDITSPKNAWGGRRR